ncbi:HAD hydrolase-like protein [Thalassospira sp. HF15]|uniref:HAD family hydrolase n=1 Tax=Thalassospira sp. HF15 TaxID=2722755 RepID=UPI001431806F|nr:HAD hydrolase-like protein [Thalassospira sp. HF15]NIY75429.1 HAD hydrolase-like protein [Thalassospira sp. HF15]
MIKAVCFDFDGTLVNSNDIKKSVFYSIARKFPSGENYLESLLHQNPPLDRHSIFEIMAKKYRLPREQELALLADFTATVHKRVVEADLMPGAMYCLKKLNSMDLSLSINSATPERELKAILRERRLSEWFEHTKGRPASKQENLQELMHRQGFQANDVLVIGDGADDQDCAEQLGCHFQPVFDFRGNRDISPSVLDNLDQLNLLAFNS